MQNIFYHNSSENLAFTGSLKQKEVHRAITLHPIKQHHHLYRLHNYMQSLKIQELQQKALTLHRELQSVIRMLDWSPSDVRTLLSSSSSSSSSPDNKSGRHWPQEEQRQQQPGDNSLNHEGKNVVDQNSKDDDDDNEDLVNQLLENNSVLSQLPSLSRYFPGNDSEVLKWDFFHRALFSHTNSNPKRKLEQPVKETLDDLVNLVMDTINKFSKQRGRVIDFKDILYGYRRVGPRHGADYILDLLLVYKKYRGRKMTIPVRKHVYLQQSFIGLETRMSPNNWWLDGGQQQQPTTAAADRKVIHFILPLAGRVDIFQRFITNFEEACLRTGQRVSLTVVVFPKASSEFSSSGAPMMAAPASSKLDSAAGGEGRGGQETTIIDVIENVQSRYPDYDIRVKMMDGPFSRAVALETGAALFGLDDLLFFVDVDVHFDVAFLDRVRLNTLQRQQVYFPIVFSQFDPTLSSSSDGAAASDRKTTTTTNVQQPRHSQSVQGQEAAESSSTSFSHNNNNNNDDLSEVDNDLGYWRHFGFGIVSLYKSDLLDIGSLDTTIQGWGKEDVDLYNKAVRSNLTIFRAAEPGLVHVFHRVECDRTLVSSQMDMCLGSKASSYASVNRLANVIYANEEILKFAELSRQNDGSLVTKQPSATSPPPPPLA